jgi:hypothetical protein
MDGISFVAGFLIGVATGLLVSPAVRWALAIREWRKASREAEPADEVVRLMAGPDGSAPEPPSGSVPMARR